MSTEITPPDAETPLAQSRVVRSNRRLVLPFAALTAPRRSRNSITGLPMLRCCAPMQANGE
jgi:hypothetical protein